MRRVLFIASLLLVCVCTPAGAATLTAAPSTLSTQISASSSGDTILLSSGTYGNITVSGQNRSTPVTIKPAPGASVTTGNISFSNSSGWDVGGFSAPGKGLGVQGSQNITVRDVAFGAVAGDGNGVVYIVNSAHVLLKGVSAGPVSRDDGIMIWPGSSTNTDITLDGLYFHDFDSDPNVDHADCVQAASFDGLTIKNSRFVNCYAQGVFVNPFGGAPARNVTIENNFITYATPPGRPSGGNALNMGDLTGGTMLVRNNTINANPTIGVDERPATTQASVVGNVFYGVSSYACSVYAGRVDVFDHNVTSGSCSGATSNTDSSTSAITAGFVSSTDLHLTSGAVPIGKAASNNAPAADIDGQARDGAPDAGADEYASASSPPPPPADTTAPDTTISTAPVDTTDTSATVAFTSSESGSTFECKLDNGSYAACSSPKSYTGLAVGAHTFSVRATDLAGNTDQSPASVTWTVASSDPCAQIQADLDAARAEIDSLNAQLDSMTANRDAWKARAEKAEDQVARIKAIAGE